MKYKEKYKPGMIFRSEEYPAFDFIIDSVSYDRGAESSFDFNCWSCLCWHRINWVAFDKFVCLRKGYDYTPDENGRIDFNGKTTFPYPSFGEMQPKSMDAYIRKYNMKFTGMSEDKVTVHTDHEYKYHAWIEK